MRRGIVKRVPSGRGGWKPKTSMGYGPSTLSQIADVTAENPIQAKSTDDVAFAALALEAKAYQSLRSR